MSIYPNVKLCLRLLKGKFFCQTYPKELFQIKKNNFEKEGLVRKLFYLSQIISPKRPSYLHGLSTSCAVVVRGVCVHVRGPTIALRLWKLVLFLFVL